MRLRDRYRGLWARVCTMDIPPPDSSGPATLSYSPTMMRPPSIWRIPRPVGVQASHSLLHPAGAPVIEGDGGSSPVNEHLPLPRCRCCTCTFLSFCGRVEPGHCVRAWLLPYYLPNANADMLMIDESRILAQHSFLRRSQYSSRPFQFDLYESCNLCRCRFGN